MRPSVGLVSPLIRLNSVVLPAPLGPMIARRSPGPTVRLTPSTARSPPNSFESPLRLSATARSVMRLGWSDGLGSASAVLARREVTVVHGLLQEILGPVLPELRDGRVGLNHGVPELAALLLHLADVDVLDRVAIRVELHRAPRRVGDLDLPQRLQKLVAAFHVAADGPGGLVDPPRARVTGLREVRRDLPVLLAVLRHELLVDRRVQRGAVDEGTHPADRLVAQRGQHELVERRSA